MQDNLEVVVFSQKKFVKALKRFWFIIAVAVIAAVAVLISLNKTKTSKVDVNVQTPSGTTYFQQLNFVSVNWDDGQDGMSGDGNVAEKVQARKDIINCGNSIILYKDFETKISAQLKVAGYKELCATDSYSINVISSEYFSVQVISQSSKERIEALVNAITDVVIKTGNEQNNLGACTIKDTSDTLVVTKSGNTYSKSGQTADEWTAAQKTKNASVGKFSVNKKSVVYAFMLVFVGVGIVVIISVNDQTITKELEVMYLSEGTYLGRVNKKESTKTAKIMNKRFKKNQLNNVRILINDTMVSNSRVSEFVKMLDSDIKVNVQGLAKIDEEDASQGTLVFVTADLDKKKDIAKIVKDLKLESTDILGFVFVEK